jgi:hypothetical protein
MHDFKSLEAVVEGSFEQKKFRAKTSGTPASHSPQFHVEEVRHPGACASSPRSRQAIMRPIAEKMGLGGGSDLVAVAFWLMPDAASLSIAVKEFSRAAGRNLYQGFLPILLAGKAVARSEGA